MPQSTPRQHINRVDHLSKMLQVEHTVRIWMSKAFQRSSNLTSWMPNIGSVVLRLACISDSHSYPCTASSAIEIEEQLSFKTQRSTAFSFSLSLLPPLGL